jgi:hypothetical protein
MRIRSKKQSMMTLQFGQKNQCKVGAKEAMVLEEMSTLKSSQVHCTKTIGKKPGGHLRNCQTTPMAGFERGNPFERLSLGERVPITAWPLG